MKIEKSRTDNKRYIIVGAIIVIGLVIANVLITSNKFETTENIPVIKETNNDKAYNNKTMAMYINDGDGDVEISVMPSSGYIINEERSYCAKPSSSEKDSNAKLYTNSDGEHVIANIQKDGKCYLYFDKEILAKDTILENVTLATGTPNFSKTSCSSGCGETTVGLYSVEDDDGTSYYFRGDVTNNYVKFADFYWRIIRINGDGSIRMIYDGTTARVNGTSSSDTQIGTSPFNSNDGDNMYVGYMYTSGSVHGLGTSSTIKEVLDDWYESNLSSYASYIDTNAGFCGDRTAYTDQAGTTVGGGTGTATTYYGAFIRMYQNYAPALTCINSNDLYTIASSTKGNKSLKYPIGLITVDEVAYAGGLYYQSSGSASNSRYYLYTGQLYWMMSPASFINGYASMFTMSTTGFLGGSGFNYTHGVRPVINLKADTKFTGDGTTTSPFQLSVE